MLVEPIPGYSLIRSNSIFLLSVKVSDNVVTAYCALQLLSSSISIFLKRDSFVLCPSHGSSLKKLKFHGKPTRRCRVETVRLFNSRGRQGKAMANHTRTFYLVNMNTLHIGLFKHVTYAASRYIYKLLKWLSGKIK